MNPLVKKISAWLSETIIACFLEFILQVFVHSWNRCIEVFNLNLKPFDVEYLFGVSNAFDVGTSYDINDFIEAFTTDDLVVLEDTNSYALEKVEGTAISKYSCSEDAFKVNEGSVFEKLMINNKENDDFAHYELLKNDNQEYIAQDQSITNIYENMNFIYDCSAYLQKRSFHNDNLIMHNEGSQFDDSLKLEKNVEHDIKANIFKSQDEKLKDSSRKISDKKFILLSEDEENNLQAEDVEKSTSDTNGCITDIYSEVELEITPDDDEIPNQITSYEDFQEAFDVAITRECSELKEVNLPENKKSSCLKLKIDNDLEGNRKDERRVHFKDEVKIYFFEPSLSVMENFLADKESSEKNPFTNMVNNAHNLSTLQNTNVFSPIRADNITQWQSSDPNDELVTDQYPAYYGEFTEDEIDDGEYSDMIKDAYDLSTLDDNNGYIPLYDQDITDSDDTDQNHACYSEFNEDKVSLLEWVENEEKNVENQKLNNFKINIDANSNENEISKEQKCLKTDVKVNELSTNSIEDIPLDVEPKKKKELKESFKDKIDRELKRNSLRKRRSEDCNLQDFPSSDIDNIFYTGKQKVKQWPKFNLSLFRKKKNDENPSSTRKAKKVFSFSKLKIEHKSLKDRYLPSFLKKK